MIVAIPPGSPGVRIRWAVKAVLRRAHRRANVAFMGYRRFTWLHVCGHFKGWNR